MRFNQNWYRVVAIAFALVTSFQGILPFLTPQVKAATLTATVRPNGDGTTTGWGTFGSGTTHADRVDDDPDSADDNTSYVQNASATDSTLFLQLGDMPADFVAARSAEVKERHQEEGTGGDDTTDITFQLTKADEVATLTDPSSTVRLTDNTYTTDTRVIPVKSSDNNKTNWDAARLKISSDYTSVGLGGDGTIRTRITAVEVTIYYAASTFPQLTQTGYIWENDDEDQAAGDANDENTQQNGGSTQITAVKKGERLVLRTQIKNTGDGALAGRPLSLFYDRNDGIFTRVSSSTPPITGAGNCADGSWDCVAVDTSNYSRMVSGPGGQPVVAYVKSATWSIHFARYVGSGGSGCSSSAWQCSTVDDSALDDYVQPTIGVSPSGKIWISYQNNNSTALSLRVAEFVGSGGTGCSTTAWTCTVVDDPANAVGQNSAIAFDPTGYPWVTHRDATAGSLKYAQYVGSNGSGCTSAAWTCGTVDDPTNSVGTSSSIGFTPDGVAWVSYSDTTDGTLKYARYVGSGGTGCTGSTAWSCAVVDDPAASVGSFNSIAIAPDGKPWISYLGSSDLKVARYVGSGGSGCGVSTVWMCSTVAATTDNQTNIAFDPAGSAWISYYDSSLLDLKVARYVGSGGSGCSDSAWSCSTIESANNVGSEASIAFDNAGLARVAHKDTTNGTFRVSTIRRAGEIIITTGVSGNTGDALSESHADMTLATDTANRDDADCIGGGTWNAGKYSETDEIELSLPPGNSTAQCTEVAFVIDTSQATEGTTYRFAVSTKDSFREDKGIWRGPVSVTAYAQLTIESATTLRGAKDAFPKLPNCTDTSWGCMTVDASKGSSLALAPDGTPWVSYFDAVADDLLVARHVGSGGSGCDTPAWSCTVIDSSTSTSNEVTSIAFDSAGTPWVSYPDTSATLSVARYRPGSPAEGDCAADWECRKITGTTNSASSNLVTSPSGVFIAYVQSDLVSGGVLKFARYLGSGGTGCSLTSAWSCGTLDDHATNSIGGASIGIAIDKHGNPWVSYRDHTTDDLRVANYVGSGGSGCSGSTDWSCTTVADATTELAMDSSIAFDAGGYAWVSYSDLTDGILKVANYVGSGGAGCTSTAWTCTTVDDPANQIDSPSSLAVDPTGNPWIVYGDNTADAIKVARYVGSGGSGCGGTAIWTCTTVYDDTGVTDELSIAFDQTGTPWASFGLGSNDIQVAKLHLPPTKLVRDTKIANLARSARGGDARYKLDWGKSPRGEVGACSSTTDRKGYCGIAATDSDFDSITALANERPMMTFAVRRTTNTANPIFTWTGRSNIAPSAASTAGDLTLQVFNHSTKAWETIATDTTSSDCSTQDCSLVGDPSGANANYYEAEGSNHWAYYRVWQAENTSGTETLKTNSTAFGNLPTTLRQRRSDSSNILTGGLTSDDKTTFSAKMFSPNASDTLTLNLEIRTIGTAFTDTATHTSSGVSCSGGTCSSGVTGAIDVTTLSAGSYHWQAWVTGTFGTGEKQSFPEDSPNAESAADLIRILTETMMRGGKTFSGEVLQDYCVAGYCR